MRGQRAQQFVERSGIFFQSEGLPRIGGRIFGLLLLADQAVSIDSIAQELKVSKPSVSTNTRVLERWGFSSGSEDRGIAAATTAWRPIWCTAPCSNGSNGCDVSGP